MAGEPDTAFDAEQFEAIYPAGVDSHYWNRCRNAVIARFLDKQAPPGALLEVGCGKGLVVAALRQRGLRIDGVELAAVPPVPEAAAYVRSGVDLFDLDPASYSEVRTVLLLDVIEHLEDAAGFIERIRTFLPGVTCIVCTVPARQELFSNYDRFNGHFRRYDLALLERHMDPTGARDWVGSYFFHLLYPAAWLQLRFFGARNTRFKVPASMFARALHTVLGMAFRLEQRLLPRRWYGTSIIAASCEKQERPRR